MVRTHSLLALAALSLTQVRAIELDVNSVDSIKSAASTLAHGMVQYYKGNETGEVPGNLPMPYFWWEAGAMFNTLINYYSLTGDSQYNAITTQALVHQEGDAGDFAPANQTKTLGNDDQSTWALAALAAEQASLPASGNSSWLDSSIKVFDLESLRWDTESCDGGLRWQIFSFNIGYQYKNSISNGQFFELAARLAHHTRNGTFSEWAAKVYKWTTDVKLIDDEFNVFDGTDATKNCSQITKTTFSNGAGAYTAGAAYMYNITTGDEQSKWKTVLDGLVNRTLTNFFLVNDDYPKGVAMEVACEPKETCNTDQSVYKGVLGQRLADTMVVAPYTANSIKPAVESSAKAAAEACTDKGCPLNWMPNASASFKTGLGEQLDALSFVQALLAGQKVVTPGSNATTTNGGSNGSGASPTGSSTSTPVPGNGAGGAAVYEKSLVIAFGVMWASMAWLM